jgi:hypothetical protein
MGFEVDAHRCAVGADGAAQPALRVVGPQTVGTFGDPIGAMYIGAQINFCRHHREGTQERKEEAAAQ